MPFLRTIMYLFIFQKRSIFRHTCIFKLYLKYIILKIYSTDKTHNPIRIIERFLLISDEAMVFILFYFILITNHVYFPSHYNNIERCQRFNDNNVYILDISPNNVWTYKLSI